MLHKLKIDKGIFLDEFRLSGVAAYSVVQTEGSDFARLVVEMDVSILRSVNDFLSESGDGGEEVGRDEKRDRKP